MTSGFMGSIRSMPNFSMPSKSMEEVLSVGVLLLKGWVFHETEISYSNSKKTGRSCFAPCVADGNLFFVVSVITVGQGIISLDAVGLHTECKSMLGAGEACVLSSLPWAALTATGFTGLPLPRLNTHTHTHTWLGGTLVLLGHERFRGIHVLFIIQLQHAIHP